MNIQKPLTAVLGELGAADSRGFAGESSIPTRQITITDGSGEIIYDKRTTDTAKAADGHIATVKYRRTGEWLDGVASVEPVPAGIMRRRKIKVWSIVAAVVLVIVAMSVSCGSQIQQEKDRQESQRRSAIILEQQRAIARQPFTATVTLDILGDGTFQKLYNTNTKADTSCQGIGGYKDLAYSGSANISGHPGTVVQSELVDGACRLTYEFKNIPGAHGPYNISLGWRQPISVTEAELKAGPARTIGG